MNKNNIFLFIGKFLGYLSFIIPCKLEGPWYQIKRVYITERKRRLFKKFGKGSILAPNISLGIANNISVGENTSIMKNCIIETSPTVQCTPDLVIGDRVSLGEYSHITCTNKITIGNGVLTGRFVLITDNSHGNNTKEVADIAPLAREIHSNGPVHIGDNVWIGDKVTILPNVTIGKGCIIAANAVVTKDIPDFSVAAGIPAKVIKTLK